MKLSVIATIDVKPENAEQAKSEMLKLVEETLKEDGCLRYELYSDLENEHKFIFKETWQSDEHLTRHTQTAHFTAFSAATKGMFSSFTVEKLTQIA